MQICQGQHPPAVIAQTDTGIVEIGAGHIDSHICSRAIFSASMACGGAGHCQAPRRHGMLTMVHRHTTVIHAAHRTMIHAGHCPRHTSHTRHPRHASHAGHPRHAGHVHVGSGTAMAHGAHHVAHTQPFDGIECGDWSLQAFAHC